MSMERKSKEMAKSIELMGSSAADVVIVTCNSSRYIEACLESIQKEMYRVIVVDNASTDGTLEIIRKRFPNVDVVESAENLGYGRACNIGFSRTKAGYVVLSNADVVYPPDGIQILVDFLKAHPEVGITCPQFVTPDGKWQISYADTPSVWTGIKDVLGVSWAHRKIRRLFWPHRIDRRPKDVPFVAGAVLVLPRAVFEKVHGFDEAFYFYADESDLCIRLRKSGWRVVFCPLTQVVHVGGGHSVRVDTSDRFVRHMVNSQNILARKHLPAWQAEFYMWSQWTFFQLAAVICRCVRIVLPKRMGARLIGRTQLFESYSRVFREYMAVGSARG
jgi:N-acetylglucosaminyl-diphospho-decaprenol L-rhamnosyltransferase